MYKSPQIKKGLFYVGVNDRTKHLFESLWPLPKGVSYNSYLLEDDKVVLFDTVDICYSDIYLSKIKSVIGEKPIDYLVISHMEPDHSGSIKWLLSMYPNLKIIGNNYTCEMLKGFYGITDNIQIIRDKEELSIGDNTLRFITTPMIHWPETMMTFLVQSKTLITGDAFGTFGTLDGGVIDSQLNPDWYYEEMIRYYANIVGKYGSAVQTAYKKLSDIEIECICSTHGPVWTEKENISSVVSLTDKLSKYETDNGLVIAYGSMYGNTEQIAEIIASSAANNGIKNIVLHNVSKSHESYILRDIFKYKGLIIGSPTYNNGLFPPIENLLIGIESRGIKNHLFGYYGSFSWADATIKKFTEFTSKMKFDIVADPFKMKQSPDETVVEQAINLGKLMAERLNSTNY